MQFLNGGRTHLANYLSPSLPMNSSDESKKKSEGKRWKEATVAVARKLLYRIYAVWTRQTPYVKYPQPAL